ncbi:GntR family transcriptional regulator [Alicyclobacillus mengziensis]|uniref:GntR family transcriptional regulator n=2 Tax=Alicyclobacillus mengziensis TaxID=2931921 RepID=A0A9X7Z5T8_9BACL|nr:GntR family transcriptional regulator [Alicyclobacillus mengziensis]
MQSMKSGSQHFAATTEFQDGLTKTDIAVAEIRHRILTGVYPKGMRLRQNELVQDLKLGVTPVREAFMQLISEGLLTRRPYAGVVVSNISVASVSEVYVVRKLLEKHATELACNNLQKVDFEAISGHQAKMIRAHRENDEHTYQAANHAFHTTIYKASKNQRLVDLIEAQWAVFPRGVFGLSVERRAKSLEEHNYIIDSLQQRDPLSAGSWMVVHIANYEQHVLHLLNRPSTE